MPSPRKFTDKRHGPDGRYDSRQEYLLHTMYPHLSYHPQSRLDYTQSFVYLPDFYLGVYRGLRCYAELKEWFAPDMVGKYLGVVDSNPGMYLVVVTPKISTVSVGRLAHPRIYVHVDLDTLPTHILVELTPS